LPVTDPVALLFVLVSSTVQRPLLDKMMNLVFQQISFVLRMVGMGLLKDILRKPE